MPVTPTTRPLQEYGGLPVYIRAQIGWEELGGGLAAAEATRGLDGGFSAVVGHSNHNAYGMRLYRPRMFHTSDCLGITA